MAVDQALALGLQLAAQVFLSRDGSRACRSKLIAAIVAAMREPCVLLDHCVELLELLGAGQRARRMFGGYGLYVDECSSPDRLDRLYLKADADTAPQFAAAGCEPFVYDAQGRRVTMSYWTVPARRWIRRR